MWAKHKQHAFTIVELLIVIVVIAVLAAITMVAFTAVQQKARNSAALNGVNYADRKIKVWQVDNPGVSPSDLGAVGVKDDGSVRYQYTASANGGYCVTASSGNVSYTVTESTSAGTGSCSGHVEPGATIVNYVSNPSMETNTSGWILNTPGFSGTSSCSHLTGGYAGNRAMRCTTSTNGTAGSYGIYTQVPGLSATKSYYLSAYVRTTVAIPIRIIAERRDGSNAMIGYVFGTAVTPSVNSWTRLAVTVPPTANMTGLTFTIYAGTGSMNAGDYIDFDAIMLTEGTALHTYADGNSSRWSWNGTPNLSTSTGPAS
jgi:prepilin-type N-terminal cleavage/methylation domain-containing protein